MFRNVFCVVVIFCCLFSPYNVFAEEKVYEADEIVITATKTEKSIAEVPGIVDVVTSEDIEKTSASVGNTVDEVINTLPGVHARKGLGSPWARIFVSLRGTGPQSRTLVLVDGQAINEYYYGSTGGANWELVPLENIEKIEVVKGPFSSLYGGNAMGGVINMITKMPEERKIKVKTKFGSYGNQFHDVNYGDKFGKLGVFIGFNRKETDGYVHEHSSTTATEGGSGTLVTGWEKTKAPTGETVYIFGDNGKTWYESNTFTGKLTYDFSERTKMSLNIIHSEAERKEKGGKSYLRDADGNEITSGTVEIDDGGTTKTFSVRQTNFLGTTYKKPSTLATLTFDHIFDERKSISAKLGITEQEWGWTIGTRLPGGSYNVTPSKNIQAEVQSNIFITDTNLLTLGLSNRYEELDNEVWALSDWSDCDSKTAWSSKLGGDINTTGIYVQDEIHLGDPFTLYAGLRYDRWANNGGHYTKAGASTIDYDDQVENQISPKLSLLYKAPKEINLRTSVGQAFRGPSPSELYRSFVVRTTYNIANPELTPETIVSWDLSADHMFGSTTFAQVAYFVNHMEDLIYSRNYSDDEINAFNTENGTSYADIWTSENVGEARSQGIELSLRHKIIDNLHLNTNYTYTDTEILDNPADKTMEGKEFIDSPRHMFNLNLDYTRQKFFVTAGARYASDAYVEEDNSDTVNDVPDGYDPYFLLNLKGSYKVSSWSTVYVGLDNILDEEYYHSYLAAGRTVYGGLSVEY